MLLYLQLAKRKILFMLSSSNSSNVVWRCSSFMPRRNMESGFQPIESRQGLTRLLPLWGVWFLPLLTQGNALGKMSYANAP